MTRKSRVRTLHYRPGGWREPVSLATFRQQMADYARGDRLRELRLAMPTDSGKRLSQDDAAHGIGVTSKTLRSWEASGPIKRENAQRAARFYGVGVDEVAAREPDDLSPGHVDLRRLERKMDALLEHFGIEVPDLETAVSEFERETADTAEPPAAPTPPRRGRRAA